MLITDVYVEGVQPHSRLQLDSLSNFNVLVGPNNAGKSTMVEAISKLLYYNTPNVSFKNKEFYSDVAAYYIVRWCFNASVEEIFGSLNKALELLETLKPEIKDKVREIGLSAIFELNVRFQTNEIASKNFLGVKINDTPFFDDKNFENGKTPGDRVSNFITSYFGNYINELTRMHKIVNSPLISIIPSRVEYKNQLMLQLKESPYSFKYDNFVSRFKEFFASFPLVIHTSKDSYSIIGKHKDESDIRIPFRLEGGGCLRAFQILTEIFLLEQGLVDIKNCNSITPILIIDEPESSMHAELQRKILYELTEFSKKAQIFIATHSPIFINPSGQRTIILLPNVRTAEKVRYIKKGDLNVVSRALGLSNKDYFLYNTILFLEGDTEEKFLMTLLNESQIDLFDYGVLLINMGSVDYLQNEVTELFVKLVLDFNVEVFVTTDKEGTAEARRTELENIFRSKNKENQFRWHIWSSNFEANFPKTVLYTVLKQCAKKYNAKFEISLEDFNMILGDDKKIWPNKLKEIYHGQTNAGLEKKQFGRCLAETVICDLEKHQDNQVIKYFVGFFDNLNIKILPN